VNPPARIVTSRHFAVPAERVFAAWLDPEWIVRWMYGPGRREACVVRSGPEPHVGGKFPFVVERRGVEVDHLGEYLEIDRPELIVFTWGPSGSRYGTSRVVVEIIPCVGGCELTLTHVPGAEPAAFAEPAAGAWHQMLDAVAGALAEANSLIVNSS